MIKETPKSSAGISLDDILKDSLTSHYVNDAYYTTLRNDMVEWDQIGSPLDEEERQTWERQILHENWLLDRREFERWYQLYSKQCIYWVPNAGDQPNPLTCDPQTNVTIAFEDRRRLGDRIVWLRTGVAYSQLPPSYTTHVSTGFVRIPTSVQGEVKIRSQFMVHELRAGHEIQSLSGWMGHVFVVEEGQVKIDRKVVCMLSAGRHQHNMTFII